MKRYLITILFFSIIAPLLWAQEDVYLKKCINIISNIQNSSKDKQVYNNAINLLSDSNQPLLTILDNIGEDKVNEYRKSDKDPFRLNSIVTHVYHIQNGEESSRGNYYDSREVGINYSMIEKSIKPNSKVTYSISGHKGMQEFVFIPYNRKKAYYSISISVNGRNYPLKNEVTPTSYHYVKIANVKTNDIINITIHNQSNKFNSFAIINHNTKK